MPGVLTALLHLHVACSTIIAMVRTMAVTGDVDSTCHESIFETDRCNGKLRPMGIILPIFNPNVGCIRAAPHDRWQARDYYAK